MKRFTLAATLAVAGLALVAAGCGGGAKKLSKDEYASQLSQICTDFNAKIAALNLTGIESFKEKGDEVVKYGEDAVKRFKKLKPPDELKSAAGTFNDSSEEVIEDLKNATEAAKDGDQAKFIAALTSAQNHEKENDEAANEIDADDCVSD